MMRFAIIAVIAWIVGVLGWSQIIGCLQNIRTKSNLWFSLLLWVIIMGVGAYFAIAKFDGLIPLLIGYGVSLLIVIGKGRIE